MKEEFTDIAEDERYITKTLLNNVLKFNTLNPDIYRMFIHYMKENNIIHHAYQMKQGRPIAW